MACFCLKFWFSVDFIESLRLLTDGLSLFGIKNVIKTSQCIDVEEEEEGEAGAGEGKAEREGRQQL